jgi:tRNA(Ile)-lysidine synthase
MSERSHEGEVVARAVRAAFKGFDRVLLAVSGGLDSMALMYAATVLPGEKRSFRVATFDHSTGPASKRAVEMVRRRAGEFGLDFVSGKAGQAATTEHEWRVARWAFLRSEAAKFRAQIATAHTMDDQVETIFIRILRDAGPRGLAALFAESEVIRPFLSVHRSDIVAYGAKHAVEYIEDPSNAQRAHLRNRVRHDLLPAISRIRPGFPAQLLSIARRSAEWRAQMSDIADHVEGIHGEDGSLHIARVALHGYDAESLRALWPSIAARANVVMDRRGTHRLAEFTMKGVTGGSIQLSGGVEVLMFRDHLLLRRWDWRRVQAARASRLGTPVTGPESSLEGRE